VIVEMAHWKVRCPPDEASRVRSLLMAADENGDVHARHLVLLFSWEPERHRTTPLRAALAWLDAEIVDD
jgi:hypothetical protein